MVGWLDDLQQRNRGASVTVAVIYKYLDDQGGYLAALITYYGFVSLFPMLLLLTTGLGVVLAGRPDLQEQVLHSALSQFPVIGSQLHQPEGLSGGTVAVVVGILGALYGGLGVGQSVQNAMDSVWAVPKNKRPNPIRARVRSFGLLFVLGSAVIAATVLSGIAQTTAELGVFGKIGVTLTAVAINALICLVAFRVTTARELTYRQVLPGAVAAAFIWQILQWFGAGYIQHTVKTASATNSIFALVLGLLAFLYLVSTALVLCAELNVVLVERLYPRALLGAFSDDAELTPADRRTYAKGAKVERVKRLERVIVRFNDVNRPVTP
ncbi:ribonuclease BN [Mycobacterium triplex]|uniref:Ribonuclease BN n=1 Tax=Mycobacterium triplex TaxID=47839 RepID=A0A024JXG3_9MYCO|nr:YihY/virulence factor BrkB family protein [Mycobacterium triplex]ORX02227.1 ribonuclease BN [Mycobacterium triplex]CDO88321.1 ribonuclease BN [Mycobacterium triplex]